MNKLRTQTGFSLIEVVLTFAIMAVATTALGLVEISNARRTQDLKARDIGFSRAQAFMERIQRMPFGTPNPPASSEIVAPENLRLTAEQFDLLFGSEDDVSQLALTQLERLGHYSVGTNQWQITEEGLRFKLAGCEDAGEWEILVDQDLDGNGVIEAEIAGVETREGLSDVLRIEIRRNDRTVLRTIRARPPDGADGGMG
jgi:type II secretory pathway pseudopilin PulG